jgi:hypothetical protein
MDMGHMGRRLRRGGLFGVEGLGLGFVRGLPRKRVLISNQMDSAPKTQTKKRRCGESVLVLEAERSDLLQALPQDILVSTNFLSFNLSLSLSVFFRVWGWNFLGFWFAD